MQPTKAIIAVAGYGTRRLPIAKAVEKCMLPLLNRPVVDYVVTDLVQAGVKDIYFVVSGDARQLRDYYSRDMELEGYLKEKGREDLIAGIRPPIGVRFHYVEQDRQDGRYGTSIPVWLCRDYIDRDESFYVIMGDQCLWRSDGSSEAARLLSYRAEQETDGALIGVPVPWEAVENYGIIDRDESAHFRGIVEKPSREAAPSNLNNASVYLLPGAFIEALEWQVERHQEGEYYLTDVINDFVTAGNTISVMESDAAYLDCGSVDGWVAANRFLLEAQAQ